MASVESQKFQDLELSRDELDRLTDALKQKEFRDLLQEYCNEVNDPENKKIYQSEITQLEKERGIDITFINPEPGYVIKTSADGKKKVFINICHNENVGKPTAEPTTANGQQGLHWQLPHTMAPPRDDLDKNNVRCSVYDVVFHPNTLHLASRYPSFKNMVTNSACDSIEKSFNLKLDKKNLKFPKMHFKGSSHAAVLRKKIDNFTPLSEEDAEFLDKLYPFRNRETQEKPKPKPERTAKGKRTETEDDSNSQYTTPKYSIKYRSTIEMEEFTESVTAKMNSAIPKELVVEILLPLIKSADDIDLDVTKKSINLKSENPSKYKLDINLPYCVDEISGNAKFDKKSKKLVIVLPVIRNPIPVSIDKGREDSGVDSDNGSPLSASLNETENDVPKTPLISEVQVEPSEIIVSEDTGYRTSDEINNKSFLNPNIEYSLPDYTCHMFKNIIAYTLHVKNVEPDSVEKVFIESDHGVHIKFSSISSGFYPLYYAFCVTFPLHHLDPNTVSIETWDNNIIVQISLENCDTSEIKYNVGIDEENSNEQIIDNNMSNVNNNSLIKGDDDDDIPEKTVTTYYSKNEQEVVVEIFNKDTLVKPPEDKKIHKIESQSKAAKKPSSYSESSGDETSFSRSPSAERGILKHRRTASRNVPRSMSESNLDDFVWTNSLENYNEESDSFISEGPKTEETCKKTVRFNDVISRQIFRSNSSILGQKKKNQRKNRNKKRTQERRHSESEVSENDERKEQVKKYSKKPIGHQKESKDLDDKSTYFKKDASKPRTRLDSGLSSDTEKEFKSIMSPKSKTNIEFKSDLIFQLDM